MERVLSFSELREGAVVWYEDVKGRLWVAEIIKITADEIIFFGCANEVHVSPEKYGKYYRCWNLKPAKWLVGAYLFGKTESEGKI